MDERREAGPSPWLREVQNQTFGPVPVRLSPDDFVDFPVEVSVGDISGFGYVSAQMLGISHALEEDITQWLRWWQEGDGWDDDDEDDAQRDADGWRQWNEDGARLVEMLQDELGAGFEVTRA